MVTKLVMCSIVAVYLNLNFTLVSTIKVSNIEISTPSLNGAKVMYVTGKKSIYRT